MILLSFHPCRRPPMRFVGVHPALWCVVLLLASAGVAAATTATDRTMVVSHTFNGYVRAVRPDGSYQPETFVLSNGGVFAEELYAGDSVSTMPFAEVARIVAEALRAQNYVPTIDQEQAQQIIMVWYGSTKRTNDPRAPAYRLVVARNARILGFQKEFNEAAAVRWAPSARDFAEEFHEDRFFVVLKAFDFQAARQDKQLKLLWESRFSIRRQGSSFVGSLPAMTAFAARTFGHETDGIYRPDRRKTTVELGDVEVVEEGEP